MKIALHIFVLLTILVLTAACENKRPAQRFNSREIPRGGGAVGGGVVGGDGTQKLCGDNCAWGKIYGDSTAFEDQVKRFASVQVPMNEIGTIDFSLNGSSTGVWFWGEMGLQGGDLRTLVTNQQLTSLPLGANSRIAVVIYDSYAVQANSGLKPIVAGFAGNRDGYTVSGSVTRTAGQIKADLRFQDQWGMIRLDGYIADTTGNLASAMFVGQASFTNTCSMTADGSCTGPSQASSPMLLGNFMVEACRFFTCN
ncbi:MAG: hypothetical protein ABL958_06305 [Bdellovibrionia bacterium]